MGISKGTFLKKRNMKTSDKYLSSDAALFNILDNSYLHVFILLLISSILIFWKLWYGSLADWDELLYANIAKSLVLPEIPDYMMFKPSLFYLLIAFSYKLFGINVLSTRLITAIFGIATVIMVYFLGKELYDKKTGFFAAILLLTSQLFILYSRLAMKDVPAAFFILGSLFFFYRAFKSSDNPSYDHTSNDDDNNSKTLMHILSSHLSVHYNTYLFFLFVLFAVGIKHMLGLLPLIVVTLYVFLFDFKKIKLLAERQVIISIIIFFLIIITWITLKISTGSFQIIDYSIDHFMIGVEGHDQDWTYYIDVFKSGSFMFVWFLPLSLLYYVLTSFKIISFRKKDYLFPDRLLFIYVISFSIILFFYQTRLPWYLISFVPVFSIMIIVMFFRVISLISYFSGAYSKNILLILCSILLLIILFGLRLPHILDCNPEIVRIIDAIDSHPGYKFYFYDTVKSPFSIFYNVNYDKDSPSYMKEYEYIDFEDAYDHAMSHDENIYVLFVDKTLDDLNDLFYNYPELKGNAFLSLIERNIILLTNNDEFIDFGIPPQEETLYHCYRYLPYWLYSYDLEDKDIVSLQ